MTDRRTNTTRRHMPRYA